ncbi:aflatoxin B1 aldehyde reductase member 2 [Colletotrichum nymphaeae SA-01]|uniref:Aflatoxin B1 aldehyde reductase member 2 n=1 Tax=Colletotrichum nymphaeae SA-01 TaxID=1460502 RepID=A0A135U7K8_9PEZI|nr:aflatoxin B1 aldehyde reductase member 2 [Colletotrichum nymphaeae SA-01]
MDSGDMRTIGTAEERRKEEEAKRKNSQEAKKEAEQQAKDSRIQDELEYAQLVHQWHSTEAERGKFAFQKCLNLDRQAVDPASLPTYSLETPGTIEVDPAQGTPSGFTSRWKNPHHFTTEWANIWGLRIEAGQAQSALSATPSIYKGQPSESLENENSFPSGSTGLRNVKTEHFEEDQVYVGEEDQVLVKEEDQILTKRTIFHSMKKIRSLLMKKGSKGRRRRRRRRKEEDYEEDEDDPVAIETDSDYGNEPYDLDDMKACLKEPPIQRLGVPGSPAASNVFKNYGLSNYSTAEVQKVLRIYEQNSPAAGGLFSGHKASSGRWKSDNFIIYGDAIIFGIFRVEQLYSTLDALKTGPLREDLAAAITTFYSKVQGAELSYHL